MEKNDIVNDLKKGIFMIPKGDTISENNLSLIEELNKSNLNHTIFLRKFYIILTSLNYVFIVAFLFLSFYFFLKDNDNFLITGGLTIISALFAILWKPQNKLLVLQRKMKDTMIIQKAFDELNAIKDENIRKEIVFKLIESTLEKNRMLSPLNKKNTIDDIIKYSNLILVIVLTLAYSIFYITFFLTIIVLAFFCIYFFLNSGLKEIKSNVLITIITVPIFGLCLVAVILPLKFFYTLILEVLFDKSYAKFLACDDENTIKLINDFCKKNRLKSFNIILYDDTDLIYTKVFNFSKTALMLNAKLINELNKNELLCLVAHEIGHHQNFNFFLLTTQKIYYNINFSIEKVFDYFLDFEKDLTSGLSKAGFLILKPLIYLFKFLNSMLNKFIIFFHKSMKKYDKETEYYCDDFAVSFFEKVTLESCFDKIVTFLTNKEINDQNLVKLDNIQILEIKQKFYNFSSDEYPSFRQRIERYEK